MALKYTGGGHVLGIPARDLTDEEVKRFGEDFLLNGITPKLYKKPDIKKEAATKKEAAKEVGK